MASKRASDENGEPNAKKRLTISLKPQSIHDINPMDFGVNPDSYVPEEELEPSLFVVPTHPPPPSVIYREELPHDFREIAGHSGKPVCKVVSLDMQSIEAQEVIAKWNEAIAPYASKYRDVKKITITKISRVQNDCLSKRFIHMQQRYGDKCTTSYHSSKLHNIDPILKDGLDQRLSCSGFFGRGVYFSDPLKSSLYYPRNPDNPNHHEKTMLVCSILLGENLQYPDNESDQKLLREPDGYDSVSGNLTGHREFVIYNNSRCLIDYIVTYQIGLVTSWEISLGNARHLWMAKNPGMPLPLHLSSTINFALHAINKGTGQHLPIPQPPSLFGVGLAPTTQTTPGPGGTLRFTGSQGGLALPGPTPPTRRSERILKKSQSDKH